MPKPDPDMPLIGRFLADRAPTSGDPADERQGRPYPRCGAKRGDGSIPDAVCMLPMGHDGPHRAR